MATNILSHHLAIQTVAIQTTELNVGSSTTRGEANKR